MTDLHSNLSAEEISHAVQSGQISAKVVVEYFLQRVEQHNSKLLAFTCTLKDRALQRAALIDAKIASGQNVGQFAGVPFAVKNLFDIQGVTTLAGSKINQKNQAAENDAELIQRLEAQGAILIGALSMGEYAYDFTGENAHYGNCANPWDTSRMSGGSSSGSGSAVAGMLVPLALGSDTNGSIRVPASFCGLFGLKPTYGRLPRTGTFPFCDSLDHLGPMARNVNDLSGSFDILQGYCSGDHACVDTPAINTLSTLNQGCESLKIKRASGYFNTDHFPQAAEAVDKVCSALNVTEHIDLTGALEGRSAAYIITNVESSRLHLSRLKSEAEDFDPDTRDRFIAGAMLPAIWYTRALQARDWYHQKVLKIFDEIDILIAPATPCVAPKIGQKMINIDGEEQLLRPNLGYFTQPISAIGLPSCVVPTINSQTNLPIGVQIIAAPWREDLCLRVAKTLENKGFQVLEAEKFSDSKLP